MQLWFIAINKKNKWIYGLNENIKIPYINTTHKCICVIQLQIVSEGLEA